MPITGNSSYIPTMNEFSAHWPQSNAALAPQNIPVRLPDNTTRPLTQFITLTATVQTQQNDVIGCLSILQMQRGNIRLQKLALLEKFHLFTNLMDGYYQNTEF